MSTVEQDADQARTFVALYERHYGAVFAFARRRTDEDTARDVTSETFLVAWRRMGEAVEGGLPWLYRTAALTLQNAVRSQRRSAALHLRLASVAPPPHTADSAEAFADRDALFRALALLSDKDRELVLLTSWEQLDIATAAGVVGCSTGAAHVRLHRARRRLRALLFLNTSSGASPSAPLRPIPSSDQEVSS